MALAADPALPQRDVLLDPQRMAARLEPLLATTGAAGITACEVTRVKYRVGQSLRVSYRIDTGDGPQQLALRLFASGGSDDAYRRACRGVVPTGRLRPVVHLRELDSVVWTFPNDRKLDLEFMRPDSPALAALLGRTPKRCRLLAYAPEKAATFRVEDGSARTLAYVKVYGGDEHVRTARIHESLLEALGTEHGCLRLPRMLNSSPGHRALAVEPLDGPALCALSGRERGLAYERLGAAVATLHELPPPDGRLFDRLDTDHLRSATAVIAVARPDLAGTVLRLSELLAQSRPSSAAPHVLLHGDLHPKNALLAGGRVALIDLDQVGSGPAAAELGGMLAGLRCDRLNGFIDARAEDRLLRAVHAGYASVRPLPASAEICWHGAAALLAERALRAVNRIRPLSLRHLGRVLDDATELLCT